MLVRLMYVSRAAKAVDADELHTLLKQCRAHNPKAGITGVLCFADGIFLQVLEGSRTAVNRLYNRIVADTRHHDVELLAYEEIDQRRFSGWAMGQVQMAGLNPALLLKYSAGATLDPYAVPGRISMALLDDLVDTAAIACERG
jgi:Sensors of blue-light using FAD